jgi:hypothetical protein
MQMNREQEPLPHCGIRSACRWFAQVGSRACSICPHVVHTVERNGTTT